MMRMHGLSDHSGEGARKTRTLSPRADIHEHEDHIAITLDLPGVPADQVDLQVEGDELRLTAKRSNGTTQGDYLVRERLDGTYCRVFRLGNLVDRDGIEGKATNGVLQIRIPKSVEALPRKIAVKS